MDNQTVFPAQEMYQQLHKDVKHICLVATKVFINETLTYLWWCWSRGHSWGAWSKAMSSLSTPIYSFIRLCSHAIQNSYRYHHEDSEHVELDIGLIVMNKVHGDLVPWDQQGGHRASSRHLVLQGGRHTHLGRRCSSSLKHFCFRVLRHLIYNINKL